MADYLRSLINNNSTYKTLAIYEGKGKWLYVHKARYMTLFQVYTAEIGELEDIIKVIVEPYDFYIYDENASNHIFVGVDKGTTNYKLETEWKYNRLGYDYIEIKKKIEFWCLENMKVFNKTANLVILNRYT